MKIVATALLLIIAVIACRCATPAPAAAPSAQPADGASQAPPDFRGTWRGSYHRI